MTARSYSHPIHLCSLETWIVFNDEKTLETYKRVCVRTAGQKPSVLTVFGRAGPVLQNAKRGGASTRMLVDALSEFIL